jgi:hypothetical protein
MTSRTSTGLTAIDGLVLDGYGRAAPGGVGHVKAAGNYGAMLGVR